VPLPNWNRIAAVVFPPTLVSGDERDRTGRVLTPHGARTYSLESASLRAPTRELRRDGPPAEGQRQIVFLRGGAELGDGFTSLAGDQVNLPADHALELVRHGAADFIAAEEAQ
jgi:hypothetical protein